MAKESIVFVVLFLSLATLPVHGYYSKTVTHEPVKEKKTELHFFLHDTLSGAKPTAVMVSHSDLFPAPGDNNSIPFGSVFVIDDQLTEGPELTSKVVGNARGSYISTSQGKDFTLVMLVDFGFTTGKFNGSSFSVCSRNPITEPHREEAVVGGRGRFRMARGFAKIKTQFVNFTNGDAVLEYHVTLFHY